jgi:tripartite-type tricarboxylate transporter receptor subunit TctC
MLAGHIDFAVGQAASTFVHVRNGNLKAYAVMAKTRWPAAPDIPTIWQRDRLEPGPRLRNTPSRLSR